MTATLKPEVVAAVIEAYDAEGVTIWLKNWLWAEPLPTGRTEMEIAVLEEWSGAYPTD